MAIELDYEQLKTKLSGAKLSTYSKALNKTSTEETVKAFFLLQDISSHFFGPLQLLELTLRNSIHDAITIKKTNPFWFRTLPNSAKALDAVNVATQSAISDLLGKEPSADDIVSRLNFGFWVFLLDEPYRNTTNACYVWTPFLRDEVFPHAPIKTKGIFEQLKIISALRNRLFHHEPIWNGSSVQTVEDAITNLKKRYANLLEVLGWMSSDQRTLLESWEFAHRFEQACDGNRFKEVPLAAPAANAPDTHAALAD